MMARMRLRCTTITPIFTTKQSLTCYETNAAKVRQWSSLVPQQREGSSSQFIGAAIPLRPLSRWRKAYEVDFRLDYQVSGFGAMTLEASNEPPMQMYINAGRHLVCFRHTAACMAVHPIAFPGIMMSRQSVYYP